MNFPQYVDRVNFHFERLEVNLRPALDAYVEAWNNQMPARKMAESYVRSLSKEGRSSDGPQSTEVR
jgi:hypothetical protein